MGDGTPKAGPTRPCHLCGQGDRVMGLQTCPRWFLLCVGEGKTGTQWIAAGLDPLESPCHPQVQGKRGHSGLGAGGMGPSNISPRSLITCRCGGQRHQDLSQSGLITYASRGTGMRWVQGTRLSGESLSPMSTVGTETQQVGGRQDSEGSSSHVGAGGAGGGWYPTPILEGHLSPWVQENRDTEPPNPS